MESAGEIVQLRPRRRRQPSARSLEIFRRYYVFGESHRAIGESMDLSRRRVGQICNAVSRWLSEQPAGPDIQAIRYQHQQTIRWLMSEVLAEWQKSKQTTRTTKAKKVTGRVNAKGQPMPDLTTTEYVEQQQCGDPRYIALLKDLMQSERTMLGADEPKKLEHSGADGGPITLANVLAIIQENPPSPPAFIDPNPSNVIDVDSCAALIADPNFMPETIPEGGLRPVPDFQNLKVEPAEVLPDESCETGESDDEPEEFVFR